MHGMRGLSGNLESWNSYLVEGRVSLMFDRFAKFWRGIR